MSGDLLYNGVKNSVYIKYRDLKTLKDVPDVLPGEKLNVSIINGMNGAVIIEDNVPKWEADGQPAISPSKIEK